MPLTKVSYSMISGETVNVLDFGADPTGATDCTAAFQAAHDYAVASNKYSSVTIPAGTYLQNSTINWSPFIQIRTNGYVVMNCAMASGFAWNISTQFGPSSGIQSYEDNAFTSLFVGGMEFNATNATNTTTCFLLGSSDTATWSEASKIFSIEGIGTTNFEGAVEIGDHCYIVGFKNCHFRGSYDPLRRPNTNGVFSRVRDLTDSGTNYVFQQCLFDQLGNAVNTRYTLGRLYLYFEACEFGACERVLALMSGNPTGGNVHTMTDCYFESRFDFGTTACFVNDCELHIKGGNVYAGNFTYNDPLFANVTSNGQMTVTGLQTSLENVVANFITGDATSQIYMNGQIVRSGTATPTNWVSTIGNKDWRLEGNALINGRITSNFTPSANWGLDYATSTSIPNCITIANSATYDLAVGSGLVMLTESTTGDGAMFFTQGGTAYKIAGSANFDDASGTAASVNLFYNAGTLKYRIQNLTGGSISLFVATIRNRNIS